MKKINLFFLSNGHQQVKVSDYYDYIKNLCIVTVSK